LSQGRQRSIAKLHPLREDKARNSHRQASKRTVAGPAADGSVDNPFSEAQFKTMKYRPGYPDRFGSIEDARRFCQQFFPWYNHQHHHSGLNLLTPANVHYGQAGQVISKRQSVLDAAYQASASAGCAVGKRFHRRVR
jgi:Integrase core domain